MTAESNKIPIETKFIRDFITASQILVNAIIPAVALTVRSLYLDAQSPLGSRPVAVAARSVSDLAPSI
jgi:hypothetical protein